MTPNNSFAVKDVDALRKFDAICDAFEQQWRAGKRPQIAEFLANIPQANRNELAKQLLDVEFERRIARQELPRIADYDRAFPDLVPWIQDRLNQLLATVSVGEGTVLLPGSSGAPRGATSENADPILGKKFGKYELVERLGMGGMGAVYRARHTMIQSERALKLLHPRLARHPEATRRFLVEAQACIELSHPNIVTTYHVDQEQDGTIYIVMELLHGENLHQLVNRIGSLPMRQAATIIQQAAAGLAFAHQRGTIHRDVKPHNIMWTSAGVAKILDLGLARILDADPLETPSGFAADSAGYDLLLTQFQSRLTGRDALLGTLPYMAPEQATDAHRADGRSDVYSLGCTFYFLLTGRHAFVGGSVEEILDKHLSAQFVPVSEHRADVPAALCSILERMMIKDRHRRYPSADAVVVAIQEWVDDQDGPGPAIRDRTEPVSLEDPHQLRDELVRLRVIAREVWDQAEQDARRQREASYDPGSSSVILDRPLALQSTDVLQVLHQRSGQPVNSRHGLSDFQIQYVLNGDQDLLRLPHHILVDQVGRGWKGDVFKARHLEVDRLEALRTFSPRELQGLDGNENERTTAFFALVDRLAAFEHPAIPQVYGAGRCDNRRHGHQVYFTTRFVEGISIHDVVREGMLRNEPKDVAWCARMAREVCYALEYAHQRGVLHLDVHGHCLMIDAVGRIHLLDLGVALLTTRRRPISLVTHSWQRTRLDDLETAGAVMRSTAAVEPPPLGTPTVMPPEQWQNRSHVSVATDIYNLGCTLFFMLTGQYPFQGSNALDSMQQHLAKPALSQPAARRIPQPLHPILERALAKLPEERFLSARAMGDAFDEFLASPSGAKVRAARTEPQTPQSNEPVLEVRPNWLSRIRHWLQSAAGR